MASFTYFDLPYELRHLIGVYSGQACVIEKEQLCYVNQRLIMHHIKQLIAHNDTNSLAMYIIRFREIRDAHVMEILTLLITTNNYECFEPVYTLLNDFLPNGVFGHLEKDDERDITTLLILCIQHSNSAFWTLLGQNRHNHDNYFFDIAEKYNKLEYMLYVQGFDLIDFYNQHFTPYITSETFKTLYNLKPVDVNGLHNSVFVYIDNDFFKFCIEKGLVVTTKLMCSLIGGKKLELVQSADIHYQQRSEAVLEYAVLVGHLDIIKFLVEKHYPMDDLILTKISSRWDTPGEKIIKLLINAGCYTGPEVVDMLVNQRSIRGISTYVMYGCAVSDNVIYHAIDSGDNETIGVVANATKHRSPQVIEHLINTTAVDKHYKYEMLGILLFAGFPLPYSIKENFDQYPSWFNKALSYYLRR